MVHAKKGKIRTLLNAISALLDNKTNPVLFWIYIAFLWIEMLPCGKSYNRLKPHGHINHSRKINLKQVEGKQQQKKRDSAMGWVSLNGDERREWRSHCPDSFTLWCSKRKLVAMETHHLQAGLPLIHSFIHVTWAVLIRAVGVCCEHTAVGVCKEHQTSASYPSGLVWRHRQTGCTQLGSEQSQLTTLHVGAHKPVRTFLPPLVTMRPRRPSLSFHWLPSSVVMPCDSAWACTLSQSGSLYPRRWSM